MADPTCSSDSLSEGELPKSSSDKEGDIATERPCAEEEVRKKGNNGENEEEPVHPSIAGQARQAEEEEMDQGEWQVAEKGAKKRKASQGGAEPMKKKKKRNRASYHDLPIQPPSDQPTYLTSPQKQLLRHLCQLIKRESNWPSLPFFKTTDLQAVVSHILSGSPLLGKKPKLTRAEQLREKKIVMVWLSMVSKADFLKSELVFAKIKSFPEQVVFSIQHPGSNRFVKLGLEAFMEVLTLSKPPLLPRKLPDSGSFSRASCLLSGEEMIDNSFPLPPEEPDSKANGFIHITEWPEQGEELPSDASSFPMFAVDCEMVRTVDGLELARVSIVDESLECVYDTLVKPPNPVLDYVTKYSGIDAAMMKDVTTMLEEVHEQLKTILPSRCILTGHSLENDLIALKLFHPYVIDTSCLFTPNATYMMKPSLKMLSKKLLSKEIQSDSAGHSSIEDATACMQLIQKKLREGRNLTIPWNEQGKDMLLPLLASQGLQATIVDKPSVTHMFGGKGLAKCVNADSDNTAVEKVKEELTTGNTQFLFVQLHAMEQYLKFAERSPKAFSEVVNSLDRQVKEVIEACSAGTLVLVACGSSYLAEVRRLQQQEVVNYIELEREVNIAREGLVTAILTPDK